jgi:hypothetical protein
MPYLDHVGVTRMTAGVIAAGIPVLSIIDGSGWDSWAEGCDEHA